MRRLLRLPALLLLPRLPSPPSGAAAQSIGAYTPPVQWPERPPRFDLVHQRIALSVDWSRLAIRGQVQTTVLATTATDTVRLDADHLTITGATDAKGRKLRFTADTTHVTVRLPRRPSRRRHGRFTLRYTGVPERGLYFVPRSHVVWTQGEAIETRSWVPTYDSPNDKTTWEFLVTADSGMSVLSNGTPGGRDPGAGRRGAGVALGAGAARPRPTSTRWWSGRSRCSATSGAACRWTTGWRPDTVAAGWRTFGETPSMIELYSAGARRALPVGQVRPVGHPRLHLRRHGERLRHDADRPGAARRRAASPRRTVAGSWRTSWRTSGSATSRPPPTWADAWLNEGLTTYMESVQNEKSRGWDAGQRELVRPAAGGDAGRPATRSARWSGASTRAPTRSRCSSAGTSTPRARRWRTSCAGCWATRCSGRGCSAS